MSLCYFPALFRLLTEHPTPELAALYQALSQPHAPTPLGALYRRAITLQEEQMWRLQSENPASFSAQLSHYQRLWREYETLLGLSRDDARHHFVVVIPVADRPQQLETCLASLLALCQIYQYGGKVGGRYAKVQVVIADDSNSAVHIAAHRHLAEKFTVAGLGCDHFDQAAQLALLSGLTPTQQHGLKSLVGTVAAAAQGHKGASQMRNLCYLYLAGLALPPNSLFYFVDSDETFAVTLSDSHTTAASADYAALNYFAHLDEIFTTTPVTVVSCPVVGDPPVSPAVMASRLLLDLTDTLAQLGTVEPQATCTFHQPYCGATDAAYHDMADLFGFNGAAQQTPFRCRLPQPHSHQAMFDHFSEQLAQFFFGTHPTRPSFYRYAGSALGVKAARTVYSGNYVMNRKGLHDFLPFAELRLRMAGPVLGRLLLAERGAGFVTANLPLHHSRTLSAGAGAEAEYRPGVVKADQQVDLSGEFERQFYGDVMLFTVEKLTALGYPQQLLSDAELLAILGETELALRQRYLQQQQQTLIRLAALRQQLQHGWWQQGGAAIACEAVSRFCDNIAFNFSATAQGYALMGSAEHRAERIQAMWQALKSYPQQRQLWAVLLAEIAANPKRLGNAGRRQSRESP
ncbi:MAG: hypothetical protein HQL49_08615 [Gammaproteobacteria bacterium]|nr:hypothetical protein [Gammaproteobacteria bacterium]